jgi:FdhD protein
MTVSPRSPPEPRPTPPPDAHRPITRFTPGAAPSLGDDVVAAEEPLEIVVDGTALAVLLRSPTGSAADCALAAGFLLAEGIVDTCTDLIRLEPCRDPMSRGNRIHVDLAPGVVVPDSARRAFVASASCGLCGKATLDSLNQRIPHRHPPASAMADDLMRLSNLARPHQVAFAATGSVHGAAIFRGTDLIVLHEDVGRHNAVDKVIGELFLVGALPLLGHTLWVSGRVSFELVQKALLAGLDTLVAVGGPTALAVDLAVSHGLNLIGFCRDGRMNLYSGSLA